MTGSKVVHLVRRFVKKEWGGIETSVLQLAKAQKKAGLEPVIWTTSMLSTPGRETIDGIEVRRFNYLFPFLFLSNEDKHQMEKKGGSPLSLSMFKALLFEEDVQLIHTHVQLRIGGIARAVSRLKQIPYVVSLHGGHYHTSYETLQTMQAPFMRKFEWGKVFGWMLGSRKTLKDASAIICVGKDEYETVRRNEPNKNVCLIPNGIDPQPFQEGKESVFRERFNLKDPYILCVSRIDSQKDQLFLIESFAQLLKEHPSYKLVLIGPPTDPSYLDFILQRASDLKVADQMIIIPGLEMDDPAIYGAYKGASCFVLPSKDEPFGIVILEAWASGVPVIATKVGGVPGFTTHETNVLQVEQGHIEQLRNALNQIINDPNLKNTLIENGLKEVKKYHWNHIEKLVHDLYNELWSEHR